MTQGLGRGAPGRVPGRNRCCAVRARLQAATPLPYGLPEELHEVAAHGIPDTWAALCRKGGSVPRPGTIGVFVFIGLVVGGFVDALLLPDDATQWPTVGTESEFEVWWVDERPQKSTAPGAVGGESMARTGRPCSSGQPGRHRLSHSVKSSRSELRLDATEIQIRRPPAGRGGRRAFVSGKKKQNTMKATVIADDQGRTLWTDALRPGRMHDATAARNEGIAICFQHFPEVEVLLDDDYLGLSRDHRGQAITPPRKPRPGALPGRVEQLERDRHGHSSDRITVEHALADHKRWKQMTRWTHRRDRLPDTYRAIASLVSDRTINA